MINEVQEPWPALEKWPFRRNSARDEVHDAKNGSEDAQQRRLDFKSINDHFQQHLAQNTYLVKPCSLVWSTGEEAKYCYVFPKYRLKYAHEKRVDMNAMMNLGLAQSELEVQQACADPKSGAYDIFRHIYLRNTFTVVYVTAEDNVRDTHRNYIQGGFTENIHYLSADYIQRSI